METQEDTIHVHDDGNFQMTHEILQKLIPMLPALKGVKNKRTGLDHLDIFVQAEEIDQYGVEVPTESGVIYYQNIRASELMSVDFTQVKLKRELYA